MIGARTLDRRDRARYIATFRWPLSRKEIPMKKLMIAVFLLCASFAAPAQAQSLERYMGTWYVARVGPSVESQWAQSMGYTLVIELTKVDNRVSIGMYYFVGNYKAVTINVSRADVVDGALMVHTTVKLTWPANFFVTQYRIVFDKNRKFGDGEYFEVRDVYTNPFLPPESADFSGELILKKKDP